MVNDFTNKDRRLILKIAKQLGDITKRVATLEKVKPSAPALVNNIGIGDDAISLDFQDGLTVDDVQRKILVESLYSVLRDLCEANKITRFDAHITNTY